MEMLCNLGPWFLPYAVLRLSSDDWIMVALSNYKFFKNFMQISEILTHNSIGQGKGSRIDQPPAKHVGKNITRKFNNQLVNIT